MIVRRLASGDLVEGESFQTWRGRLGDALVQNVQGARIADVYSNGVVIFEVYQDKGPPKNYKTSYLVGLQGQFTFSPPIEIKQAWVEAEEAAIDADSRILAAEGESDADKARKAQAARAKKYGIAAHDGGKVTKASEWAEVPDDEWLDPVNYAYPCPDETQCGTASKYWGKAKNKAKYSEAEQKVIDGRLDAMKKKFKIAEYAAEEVHAPRADMSSVRTLLPLQLEGEALPAEIPIHVIGEWDHPQYGKFQFTEEMRDKAIANFKARLYRPNAPVTAQVVIDEKHEGGEANGWLTDMFPRGKFLMAKPDWNELGAQKIRDKRYRYISPCYLEDFEGNGPLFKEVTLTNRPFLRELPNIGQPVLLSEDAAEELTLFLTPVRSISGEEPPRGGMGNDANENKGGRNMGDTGNKPAGAEQNPGADTPGQVMLTEVEVKELRDRVAQATELEKRLATAETQLAKAETEAKGREIEAALKDAGLRGVDAFTLKYVKGLLLQLPRGGTEEFQLEVDGGSAQKVNLYTSLLHFLKNVPAKVPVGEFTRTLDTPPGSGKEDEVDKEAAKALGKSLSDAAPVEKED